MSLKVTEIIMVNFDKMNLIETAKLFIIYKNPYLLFKVF